MNLPTIGGSGASLPWNEHPRRRATNYTVPIEVPLLVWNEHPKRRSYLVYFTFCALCFVHCVYFLCILRSLSSGVRRYYFLVCVILVLYVFLNFAFSILCVISNFIFPFVFSVLPSFITSCFTFVGGESAADQRPTVDVSSAESWRVCRKETGYTYNELAGVDDSYFKLVRYRKGVDRERKRSKEGSTKKVKEEVVEDICEGLEEEVCETLEGISEVTEAERVSDTDEDISGVQAQAQAGDGSERRRLSYGDESEVYMRTHEEETSRDSCRPRVSDLYPDMLAALRMLSSLSRLGAVSGSGDSSVMSSRSRRDERNECVGMSDTDLVKKFTYYKVGDDINKYFKSFESTLNSCDVRRDRYLKILMTKLPPTTSDLVVDIVNGGGNYEEVKAALLDNIGSNDFKVKKLLFGGWANSHKTTCMRDMYSKLKPLHDRFVSGTVTHAQLSLKLLFALFRVCVPTAGSGILETKAIEKPADVAILAVASVA